MFIMHIILLHNWQNNLIQSQQMLISFIMHTQTISRHNRYFQEQTDLINNLWNKSILIDDYLMMSKI